jgi:hypothetical protein
MENHQLNIFLFFFLLLSDIFISIGQWSSERIC